MCNRDGYNRWQAKLWRFGNKARNEQIEHMLG